MVSVIISQQTFKINLFSISQLDYIIQSHDIEAMERYHLSFDEKIEIAIKYGINKFINRYKSKLIDNIDNYFYLACQYANIEIINFLLQKKANINYGFNGACKGDKVEIVKLMIIKGATDIYSGQREACIYGSLNVLIYLETIYGLHNSDDLICCAFENKHFELLKHLEKYYSPSILEFMRNHGFYLSKLK